jgi:hypothetical protein
MKLILNNQDGSTEELDLKLGLEGAEEALSIVAEAEFSYLAEEVLERYDRTMTALG